jgi:DNA repair protein RecO (recombination protein O)
MEWTDEAIVLGVRKHGETAVIAELMTNTRGRHLGLVQGGRGRVMRPVLQPGNRVRATWRARLDEHLGTYKIEGDTMRVARLMEKAHGIYTVQVLTSLLRLLPERDPHKNLYDAFDIILDSIERPAVAGELVVRFELAMLEELGFGLDLGACAATGSRENLIHVSPKSGRAVSREAGEPYADRLLSLPTFLTSGNLERTGEAPLDDIVAGFALSGHFLHRHVYGPRGIEVPPERAALVKAVSRELE